MTEITVPTVQVTNVKMRKNRTPMLSFDLTIALPNPPQPHRPFVITIRECTCKPFRKYQTRENPAGWHWVGPPKYLNRMEQYAVHSVSDAMHDAVLGILNAGAYLKTSEHWSTEWFDARWRYPDKPEIPNDPATGILR